MASQWTMFCTAHRESLYVGKSSDLVDLEDVFKTAPLEALGQLRQRLSKVASRCVGPMSRRHPDARDRAEIERWLSLVEAFVVRHSECSLELIWDGGRDVGPGWVHFNVDLDLPLWSLQDELLMEGATGRPWSRQRVMADRAAHLEKLKAEIDQTHARIAQVVSQVDRNSLKQDLDQKAAEFESSEWSYRSQMEFYQSQRDVLQEIQGAPRKPQQND